MQRGQVGFPYPTGKNTVVVVPSVAGLTTQQGAGGAMKASIVLFDTTAGTRTYTVPNSVSLIRVFVVGGGGAGSNRGGAGGGYAEKILSVTSGQTFSYTVGAGGLAGGSPTNGGTSSFGGILSATGGETPSSTTTPAGGVGSGGTINTSGGGPTNNAGGASSGHRFGNGRSSFISSGAGWIDPGGIIGGNGGVDGFGLGIVPGQGGVVVSDGTFITPAGYGAGGASSSGNTLSGGIGGGAGAGATGRGGVGGGGGANSAISGGPGGDGAVGVEILG